MNIVDMTVERLNQIEGLAFVRDAWQNKAPDNYGVVELTGQSGALWADDAMALQCYALTITIYVHGDDDSWCAKVQEALQALDLGYSLPTRAYDYDIDAVEWQWTAWWYGPLEVEAEG